MSKNKELSPTDNIQNRILTIRGIQVILDRDLAKMYQTETRVLKQSVKRNMERFPDDFMFELTEEDISLMVSQSVIPSKSYFGGAKPFAFTEQGVSMLSLVIKTTVAIDISIKIIRAFVEMRQFISANAGIFQRIEKIEIKQIQNDQKFEKILNALEEKSIQPRQGIFFDGQVFEAYIFVVDLIKSAIKSIVLIDNYVDESVLNLFTKRKPNVDVTIYTKNISAILKQDLKKHNAQYRSIKLKQFDKSHDRFVIIDETTVYHFGASLKDLGKKWFAFSRMDIEAISIIQKIAKESSQS